MKVVLNAAAESYVVRAIRTAGRPLTLVEVFNSDEAAHVLNARGHKLKYINVETEAKTLLKAGKVAKLPRYNNEAIKYRLPEADDPAAQADVTEHVRREADRQIALILAVLELLRENGNYMSPEKLGEGLVLGPGMPQSVSVEEVTTVCNSLFHRGWLRTVGGAYCLRPRKADDTYGTPSFKRASTVGGMLGSIMLDEVGKLVEACGDALYPNGDGREITAEMLPAKLAELRADLDKARLSWQQELSLRHDTEKLLANDRARWTSEVKRLDELLQAERAASAKLAERFAALRVIIAALTA
jgi:hypothetical protein